MILDFLLFNLSFSISSVINSCVLYNEIKSLKNDKIELISEAEAEQNERINKKKLISSSY